MKLESLFGHALKKIICKQNNILPWAVELYAEKNDDD